MEVPYNPLDRKHLAESIADALLGRDLVALPPPASFDGAGVYAIYYLGDFPEYRHLARPKNPLPIYVGKAVPKGASTGFDLTTNVGQVLLGRLKEHADSIRAAQNLELADFRCRYLVTDDIWIPLGESLLISRFRPLWNSPLTGFGNHNPGGKRLTGTRSKWDTVHPGRTWAWGPLVTPQPESAAEILASLPRALAE